MTNYRHLIVAVDLSDESRPIVDRAKDEAQRHGAQLSLITVIKPFLLSYGAAGYPMDYSPQVADIEAQVASNCREQLATLGAEVGVPAERQYVALGNPAAEVRRSAKEQGADLIVIGSHGRQGLGILLGSTANGVLHGCDVDVLVVRIPATD